MMSRLSAGALYLQKQSSIQDDLQVQHRHFIRAEALLKKNNAVTTPVLPNQQAAVRILCAPRSTFEVFRMFRIAYVL